MIRDKHCVNKIRKNITDVAYEWVGRQQTLIRESSHAKCIMQSSTEIHNPAELRGDIYCTNEYYVHIYT